MNMFLASLEVLEFKNPDMTRLIPYRGEPFRGERHARRELVFIDDLAEIVVDVLARVKDAGCIIITMKGE